jgi:hypothetical protein
VCTPETLGRATAQITGVLNGRPFASYFNLNNGCEIGRWLTLQDLLGDPRGLAR